jgi:hypothetical protein
VENKQLIFDDGLVEFDVNGKAKIVLNPTDSAFVEKLYSAFENLDAKQEAYKARVERVGDKKEIFDIAREMDAEMRSIVDGMFGPISDALFGGMSTYAMAGGLPIWCNFMLAVMDEIDTTFSREQKATNPRIAKYTSKYHR